MLLNKPDPKALEAYMKKEHPDCIPHVVDYKKIVDCLKKGQYGNFNNPSITQPHLQF
jgi:hypothetical protein